MTCTECGLGFDPADDEEDVCPSCQLEWARENCPELLGGSPGSSPENATGLLAPARPPSDRKLRLFAVACCRQVWHLLADPRSRRAVEVAERYADGEATAEELVAAWNTAEIARVGFVDVPERWLPANYACEASAPEWDDPGYPEFVTGGSGTVPPSVQAALLRCLFGNPFRPAGPLRFNEKSRRFAESIYAERDFGSLPILADMLEECGCEPPELIAHFREPKPHARGCWALDLLLGKE